MRKRKHAHTAAEKGDDARSEKINSLVSDLFIRLGVAQQWAIRLSFHDKLRPHNVAIQDMGSRIVSARCSSEYPYRVITIEMTREYVDYATDYDLVKTLVHEVLHVVPMAPLSRYGETLLGKETAKDAWWLCLEEEAVEILSLWISRLWLDLQEATAANSRSGKGSRRSKGRAAKG